MKPILVILSAAALLAACNKQDLSQDRGVDNKHVSQMKAGIWVDPHGCDHWIIDDGAEGYMSQRLDRYGKPVCSGIAAPNTAVGDYNSGGFTWDPI